MNTLPPNPALSDAVVTGTALMTAANRYVAAGLSVIPIAPDGSKSPAWTKLPKVRKPNGEMKHAWKPFQSRRPTPTETEAWYRGWGPPCGIAVIGGDVSGGLEIIDFDTIELFEPWCALVAAQDASLLDRLVLVQTPRPGMHVYFRCIITTGSQKLASRLETDPETHIPRKKALIETKGEGGYCLLPPSPFYCHPSRRPYRYTTDRDLTAVAEITPGEREILMTAARSFDETPQPVEPARRQRPATAAVPSRRHMPGDDFNACADWGDILERNGWTYAGDDGTGKQFWRRPGKTDGISATVNFEGNGLLHNFSTNAPPLEEEKSYTKFQFVALVEYDGDFSKAANALREQGYGLSALRGGNRRRRRARRRRGSHRRR